MFRRDIMEYPREPLRESIANALAHRDYSPYVRGSYIQMRMMEDLQVVENRGSGISAMLHAMREANLEPPRFDDRRSSFMVTFHNHTLMTAEAVSWLNQFSHLPFNDHQRLALVYLRRHSNIDNRDYRRLNRCDMMAAVQDLRGMVQTGFGHPGRGRTHGRTHGRRAPGSFSGQHPHGSLPGSTNPGPDAGAGSPGKPKIPRKNGACFFPSKDRTRA